VSSLSTYMSGALAAVLILNCASVLPGPQSVLGVVAFDEITSPGAMVNRALKGDRWVGARPERDAKPIEAPLEVVDVPTGSTARRSQADLAGAGAKNVTFISKHPLSRPNGAAQPLPVGCESAFGRLAAPPLARIPSRCIL